MSTDDLFREFVVDALELPHLPTEMSFWRMASRHVAPAVTDSLLAVFQRQLSVYAEMRAACLAHILSATTTGLMTRLSVNIARVSMRLSSTSENDAARAFQIGGR